MDIIKEDINNNNIIAGLATGYNKDNRESFYKTDKYTQNQVEITRTNFQKYISNKYNNNDLKFIYQKQKHSDIVLKINQNNILTKQVSDAVITNEQNLILNASVADCTAVILYDNKKHVVGLAHSGWRGTQMNIVAKTVRMMKQEYDIKIKDLNAVLLASASHTNYEVGREFLDYFPNNTIILNNKYYYNNQNRIQEQLMEIGLKKNKIKVNTQCTISNKRYHSYRRDGIKSGRMNAYIGIIG